MSKEPNLCFFLSAGGWQRDAAGARDGPYGGRSYLPTTQEYADSATYTRSLLVIHVILLLIIKYYMQSLEPV
jgi:hypothetical protein